MAETTKSALDRLNERMRRAREERGDYTKTESRTMFDGIVVEVTKEYRRNKLWNVVTDYTLNGRTVRVIDFRTNCGAGRSNAELLQLGTDRPARTYKSVSNAHAKAVELLLG